MAGKRSFSDDNIPVKADDYHGLAGYVRTQPDIASQGVKSVNIDMTFEEALRLSLAIQSCLLQLNRYKRSRHRRVTRNGHAPVNQDGFKYDHGDRETGQTG